ncbi:hypothetical protein [Catellatospora sichuanensis]|uniref:hypothetical protein n=1 Tax=Catellatospora sichuanensis TaxID=1969805 RepID=UPI00118322B4|nr:hypothetical protein [Catellatospora sichuanensis]
MILGLLGIALCCVGLGGSCLLFQELGALIGGDAGVVVVSDCGRTKYEWDCYGQFRAADGSYTIDEVSLYVDDAATPQPGDELPAKVFGEAANQAVTPGNWGNIVPYLIMAVGLGGIGVGSLWMCWQAPKRS